MTPIQAALQLVHPTDNTNHTYADHCTVARTKHMDHGLAFDNECPNCKGGVDPDIGECDSCHMEWCPAHLVVYGEGSHCAACEALGAMQQAIGMRVHPACNTYYLRWYNDKSKVVRPTPPEAKRRLAATVLKPGGLRDFIAHYWTIGRDQCLLDAMALGYSMCVVQPLIVAIHGQWDAAYAAHCAEHEADHTDYHPMEGF